MKTYRVSSQITISVFTDVEARNPAEAKKEALERQVQALCFHCARGAPSEEWVTSGELAGEPQDISGIRVVKP